MEFRVFSRLRGRRSWLEGLWRLTSPTPGLNQSVLVLDVPVFRHRLMVMAALAKGLPVLFVPEQLRVAAMRSDVIHNGRRYQPAFRLAPYAPRVTFQEELPGFLPTAVVSAEVCILPFALAFPFVFLTVLPAIRHESRAARIPARCLWSSRHNLLPSLNKTCYTESTRTAVCQ